MKEEYKTYKKIMKKNTIKVKIHEIILNSW